MCPKTIHVMSSARSPRRARVRLGDIPTAPGIRRGAAPAHQLEGTRDKPAVPVHRVSGRQPSRSPLTFYRTFLWLLYGTSLRLRFIAEAEAADEAQKPEGARSHQHPGDP
jgi:hypothetical protein